MKEEAKRVAVHIYMAESLGMSPSSYSEWHRGTLHPHFEAVSKQWITLTKANLSLDENSSLTSTREQEGPFSEMSQCCVF